MFCSNDASRIQRTETCKQGRYHWHWQMDNYNMAFPLEIISLCMCPKNVG